MDLTKYINLLPDIYDKTEGVNPSNIRKIFEVIADQFADIVATAEANRLIKDIGYAQGTVLDTIGLDYGLQRYGKTDEQFRAFILAKIFARISGNSIDKILRYFSFFIGSGNVRIVPLTDPEFLYPIFAGRQVHRAFSVEVDNLSIEQLEILKGAVQFLKAAGIYATINIGQQFNQETDLWGSADSFGFGISANYEFAGYDRDTDSVYTLDVDRKDQLVYNNPVRSFNFGAIPAIGGASPTNTIMLDATQGPVFVLFMRSSTTESVASLFHSTNDSFNWSTIPLPAKSATRQYQWVSYINGNIIIAEINISNANLVSLKTSTNSGASWTSVGVASSRVFSQVNALPYEPYRFRAQFGSIICIRITQSALSEARVLRSTDSGVTWSDILVQAGSTELAWEINSSPDGVFIIATGTAVNVSTDSGATWTTRTFAALGVSGLASVVYARHVTGTTWLLTSASTNKVYRTTDNFATVSLVSHPLLGGVWTVHRIYVYASRTMVTLTSGFIEDSIIESFDNGATWQTAMNRRIAGVNIQRWLYGASYQIRDTIVWKNSNQFARTIPGVNGTYIMENNTGSPDLKYPAYRSYETIREFQYSNGSDYQFDIQDTTFNHAIGKDCVHRHVYSSGKLLYEKLFNLGHRRIKVANGLHFAVPYSSKTGTSSINWNTEVIPTAIVSLDKGKTFQPASITRNGQTNRFLMIDVIWHEDDQRYYALYIDQFNQRLFGRSTDGINFTYWELPAMLPDVSSTDYEMIGFGSYLVVAGTLGAINAYNTSTGALTVVGNALSLRSFQRVGDIVYFTRKGLSDLRYYTIDQALTLTTHIVSASYNTADIESYVTLDGVLHFWFGKDFFIRSDANSTVIQQSLPAGVYPDFLLTGRNAGTGNAASAWAISPNHKPTLHKIRFRLP